VSNVWIKTLFVAFRIGGYMGQVEFILSYGFFVGFGILFISRGLSSVFRDENGFVVFRIGIEIGG